MKSGIFFTAAIMLLSIAKMANADTIPPTGKLGDVEAQSLFVPIGFDDNDETVVVLDGYLPDTCFKVAPAMVSRDLEHHQIIVEQQAREFQGPCLDMLVPFTTTVKIGLLPEGEFSLVTNHGKLIEKLPVKKAATIAADDFQYAPIDTVHVEKRSDGTQVAVMTGRFTNQCARIEKVMVTNHEKTLEVMPIMLLDPTPGAKCLKVETPFRYELSLPALSPERHLLHVRGLDGQSINVVFRGLQAAENR